MINFSNDDIGLDKLLLIFEQFSTHHIPPIIKVAPHSIDFSTGTIFYDQHVNDIDLISLVTALISNVDIKRVECRGLRIVQGLKSLNFNGLIAVFQIYSLNKSVIDVNISPHIIETSLGYIYYDKTVDNYDLISLLCALESNVNIKRVECLGLETLSLEGITTLFQICSLNKSVIDVDISPHSIDTSLGVVYYDKLVDNYDLIYLLSALKSSVNIKRVECLGLETVSVEGIITLFEVLSINKSVIDVDISPHIIDVENAVFCFLPESLTQITSQEVTSLGAFLEGFTIKELTLQQCCFAVDVIPILCDLIRGNRSLNSVDFSYIQCSGEDFYFPCAEKPNQNFSKLINAIRSNSNLKMINFSNDDIGFDKLLLIFEQFSTHHIPPIIKVAPHSIDFSTGTIFYDQHVNDIDLTSLVTALISNVHIKRVECLGLETLSLEGIFTLFEVLSINKSVIDVDISPHLIDIENAVFCFSPETLTQITSEELTPLPDFLDRFTIKEFTVRNCLICQSGVPVLHDVIKNIH
ncbi:hypothetical protein GEMRC1_010251 [Eukaryota sp. GEM-RC1]